MKLQISDSEQTGFLVSPAHADRGDGSGERDYVYVGRYHCGSPNFKSVSGTTPTPGRADRFSTAEPPGKPTTVPSAP